MKHIDAELPTDIEVTACVDVTREVDDLSHPDGPSITHTYNVAELMYLTIGNVRVDRNMAADMFGEDWVSHIEEMNNDQ